MNAPLAIFILTIAFTPAVFVSIILYRPFDKVKLPRRRYVLTYGEPGWKRRWEWK